MKVIVFALVIAVAIAAPQTPDHDAQVLRSELENIGVDGYKFGYETSNGISADEEGHVVNAGSEAESIAVSGHFTYQGPDGVQYSVEYTADDEGFKPHGDHIPTK